MKTYLLITLKNGTEIRFGEPTTKSELEKMYRLRYEVYVKEKGYIPETAEYSRKRTEVDDYDKQNLCTYFIATINSQVVGTTRIIRKKILPTETDYFSFNEPESIKQIPRGNRAEIGRIISRPQKLTRKKIPRGITMLGLLYVMSQYGLKQGIQGGYGSIKNSAFQKFKKIGLPLHEIKDRKTIYDAKKSEDPLTNFFSETDPVVLVYFITQEINRYLSFIIENTEAFESVSQRKVFFTGKKIGVFKKMQLWFMSLTYAS